MTCHPCVLQLKTQSTKDIILCGIFAICMFHCHLVECAQSIVYYCFFDVPDASVGSNPLVTWKENLCSDILLGWQLCVWGTDGWEKRKSKFVQVQPGRGPSTMGDTRVQFHNDQIRLLVVHESQLAIYDAAKLERLRHVRDWSLAFVVASPYVGWREGFVVLSSWAEKFLIKAKE